MAKTDFLTFDQLIERLATDGISIETDKLLGVLAEFDLDQSSTFSQPLYQELKELIQRESQPEQTAIAPTKVPRRGSKNRKSALVPVPQDQPSASSAIQPVNPSSIELSQVDNLDTTQVSSLLAQYSQLEQQGEEFDNKTIEIIRALVERQSQLADLARAGAAAVRHTRQDMADSFRGLVEELSTSAQSGMNTHAAVATIQEAGPQMGESFRQRTANLESAISEFRRYAI